MTTGPQTNFNNHNTFVDIVISRKHFPKGSRHNYIPGLNSDNAHILTKYKQLFDSFTEETIESRETLMQAMCGTRLESLETLEKMDMAHSSKIAWKRIKKLSGDRKALKQIAHQLSVHS